MHTLVIHGGAGALSRELMSPETEEAFRDALTAALHAGNRVLARGGDALTAVETAVVEMEDSPLFNAGRGSNFTRDGVNEMDASIMDGRDLRAGAVAMLRRIRNPVSLARRVLEDGRHVLLCAEGARRFAGECGISEISDEYFHTEFRWRAMLLSRDKGVSGLSEDIVATLGRVAEGQEKFGTVGAVALDDAGDLAAATSTGGTTAKYPGRVGDSALIGSGTYADNETCAVSATGHGEFFIRKAVAHEISSLMRYRDLSVEDAADEVVNRQLVDLGGRGGVIALDRLGNIAMPFNTPGMYRGYIRADGSVYVGIFKEVLAL